MNAQFGTDTELLDKGVSIIHAIALAFQAARRNKSLSKHNRQFYERQEAALQEVVRVALLHMEDIGVGY